MVAQISRAPGETGWRSSLGQVDKGQGRDGAFPVATSGVRLAPEDLGTGIRRGFPELELPQKEN